MANSPNTPFRLDISRPQIDFFHATDEGMTILAVQDTALMVTRTSELDLPPHQKPADPFWIDEDGRIFE